MTDLHTWLITIAVHNRVPLRLLSSNQESMTTQWNVIPPPGITESDIRSALCALAEQGLILISANGIAITKAHVKTTLGIHSDSVPDAHVKDIIYELTRQGGEWWEQRSRPDWSRFFAHTADDSELSGDGTIQLTVTALSEIMVRKALRSLSVTHDYWSIPGTEVYASIAPFSATYWKYFEIGWQVKVEVVEGFSSVELWNRLPRTVVERISRDVRITQNWYGPS